MYIEQKLENLNNKELAELWMRFVHGEYDEIRPMSDFDEYYENSSPTEIVEARGLSDHFSTADPYWHIDSGTAAPESGSLSQIFDDVYDESVLVDAIEPYENDATAMEGIDWQTDEELVENELVAFVNDVARGGWKAPYRTVDVLVAFAKATNNVYAETTEWLFDGMEEKYADKDDFIQAIEEA